MALALLVGDGGAKSLDRLLLRLLHWPNSSMTSSSRVESLGPHLPCEFGAPFYADDRRPVVLDNASWVKPLHAHDSIADAALGTATGGPNSRAFSCPATAGPPAGLGVG